MSKCRRRQTEQNKRTNRSGTLERDIQCSHSTSSLRRTKTNRWINNDKGHFCDRFSCLQLVVYYSRNNSQYEDTQRLMSAAGDRTKRNQIKHCKNRPFKLTRKQIQVQTRKFYFFSCSERKVSKSTWRNIGNRKLLKAQCKLYQCICKDRHENANRIHVRDLQSTQLWLGPWYSMLFVQ